MRRNVGVLLLHGMTGSPTEMRPVEKHLVNMGLTVKTPILAGHDKDYLVLRRTRYEAWLQSARDALIELQQECDQVFVVGLCMGAMLAIVLGHENPDIAGLGLLSCEVGYYNPNTTKRRYLFPIAFKFPSILHHFYWTETPPYGLKNTRLQNLITSTINESKKGNTTKFGSFRTYGSLFYEIHRLRAHVNRLLPEVHTPALLIHSLEDTMLTFHNALDVYQNLGSEDKTVMLMNGTDHMLTMDLRKKEVAALVGQFIEERLETACPDLMTSQIA